MVAKSLPAHLNHPAGRCPHHPTTGSTSRRQAAGFLFWDEHGPWPLYWVSTVIGIVIMIMWHTRTCRHSMMYKYDHICWYIISKYVLIFYTHTHTLYIHYTYIIHTLYIHYTYIIHTLYIHYTYIIHTLYIHCYIIHTLYIHYTYIIHTLYKTNISLEEQYNMMLLPARGCAVVKLVRGLSGKTLYPHVCFKNITVQARDHGAWGWSTLNCRFSTWFKEKLKWFSWIIARLEFFEVAFFTHNHFFFFVSTFQVYGVPLQVTSDDGM